MKKIVGVLIILVLLLSTAACSSRFETQEAMFDYLNGMWIVDDLNQDEYYIFQDGQIHQVEDWGFQYEMDSLMDDVLKNDGIEALCQLNYQSALDLFTTEDILEDPYSSAEINSKKGEIVLNKNESNEKHIIVEENSVGIKAAEEENTTPLKKVSDKVDFSGAHFEALFNKAKEEYNVSTAEFWTDTKTYGDMVKAFNPEIDGWNLTTSNETTTIYESSKWVSSISGSFIVTDELVSFSRKVSLLNSWTSNIDWNPEFTVLYTPGQSVIVRDKDNMSLNMGLLIQYAANAFRNFPGAADHIEVNNIIAAEFEKGNYTIADGAAKVEKTIDGITYMVMQGTDNPWGYVYATANDTVSLTTIASNLRTEADDSQSEETKPEETQDSTTDASEPVETVPMNEVPYITELSASVGIYSEPDSGSTYVQSVGEDGVYTIVEESYDSAGNLWGKLKSGLGWVLLKQSSTSSVRTCPQCGQAEPDAFFDENWQAGDICVGCRYDNFHGGEEGKLYCSQCGADCTYRGLEEDGRCEDCYFGN